MHKPTERVLKILLLLSANKSGLSLTSISNNTNFPKSTISPILSTLLKMKFIVKTEGNLFKIGINSSIVGSSFVHPDSIIDIVKPYMEEIVLQCNEICQLGVLNNKEVFYIEKVEPDQPIQLISNVGKLLPAYSTALGKSLISKYNLDEIRKLYGGELYPLTENTITNIENLIQEIEMVKKKKYSIEKEETGLGIECVAVPLEKKGDIIASVSISIPVYRSSKEKIEEIIKILLNYKEKIEERIKYLD